MGIEYELKFRAAPAAQQALLAALALPWQTISMETTYYDTPDMALSQRRYTLRRRLENGVSVCTVKTPAGDLGRGEWEVEKDTVEEAIPELCKLGAPEDLGLLTQKGVAPVCGARFTRQAAVLTREDTTVELAVDAGILFSGQKQVPLREVEVELKSGSRETAKAIALELALAYGLTPEKGSKFRRALALREENG